jgi:hypothetical protein
MANYISSGNVDEKEMKCLTWREERKDGAEGEI